MKMIRTVTAEECPWVINDLKEGTEVYEFIGPTYGCITSSGVAISLEDSVDAYFYEVPKDSVR